MTTVDPQTKKKKNFCLPSPCNNCWKRQYIDNVGIVVGGGDNDDDEENCCGVCSCGVRGDSDGGGGDSDDDDTFLLAHVFAYNN